jgi:pSer/pThr/pTyr-binding forkhead associated (FHA) protein
MMIQCPFCHTAHVYNTIFCNECGAYLLEDENSATDSLDTDELGWVGDATSASRAASPSQPGAEPLAVRLKIGAGKREVEMPLGKAIHMGRMDPALAVLPEIDLTNDDIMDKSISRRHARIVKEGSQVVVEDLGSINGTFINGKRLVSYLPKPLSDGDTLQLGKLLIKVQILSGMQASRSWKH